MSHRRYALLASAILVVAFGTACPNGDSAANQNVTVVVPDRDPAVDAVLERAGFPPGLTVTPAASAPQLRLTNPLPDPSGRIYPPEDSLTIRLAAAAMSERLHLHTLNVDGRGTTPASVRIDRVTVPESRAAVPRALVTYWWVEVSLALPVGDYPVDVVVRDDAGRVSAPESVRVRRAATPGTVHVLAVGVNNYREPCYPDLVVAEADARAVHEFFESAAGGSCGGTGLLLGDAATKEAIGRGLDGLAGAAPQDTVVFYFAGHGMAEDNVGYLIPVEATTDLGYSAISVANVRAKWARIQARRKVFIADSCNSGIFVGLRDPGQRADFAAIFSGTGTASFLAAQHDQTAKEDATVGHGVFTRHLLDGLRGAADRETSGPGAGIVSLNELADYLGTTVPIDPAVVRMGTPQIPQTDIQAAGGLIPISYPGRRDHREVPPPPPTPVPPVPPEPTRPGPALAALELSVQEPTDGKVCPSRTVGVYGTITPAEAPGLTVTVQGQPANLTAAGVFSAIVTLPEGASRTIRVEATASDGRTSAVTRTVTVDATPPELTLAAPANGLRTNAATVNVTGTCTESDAAVAVNGTTVPVAAGRFSLDLALPEGPTVITVTARDRAGHEARAVRITVMADRRAPRLEILVPAEGALVGASPVPVQGLVDDPEVTQVVVAGRAVPVQTGQWRADVEVREGANPIAVSARDLAGNVATVTRTVQGDLAPPALTVTEPAANATVAGAEVAVAGRVDDATATVTVNVTAVAVAGDGSFRATVPLTVGANDLRVVARDRLGRETVRAFVVTRSAPAPATPREVVIAFDAPVRGELAAGDTQQDGKYVDWYVFDGRQGDGVNIVLNATGFDAFVILEAPGGQPRWTDDNGGGGTNAALSQTLPAAGRYRIGATSFGAGSTGTYELVLRRGGAAPSAGDRPTVTGFTWLRQQQFTCGGQTRTVEVYRHDGFAQALGLAANATDGACEFVLVPRGTFAMGENPQHQVTMRPYLMARTEVTQRVWRGLVGSTGLNASPSYSGNAGERAPVEQVSWEDVTRWCGANSVRLPSEAEWEYACRAGTTTRFNFGDNEGDLGQYAWFSGNSGRTTHPVGSKGANAFGLYDTHGNVWEWCQDLWHDSYTGAPTDGTAWEGGAGSLRVRRGGGYGYVAGDCRSAFRPDWSPGYRICDLGFRPSRSLP